jgi:hypothetical protein
MLWLCLCPLLSPPLQPATVSADGKTPVVDVQWDALSPYYLLVAYKSGACVSMTRCRTASVYDGEKLWL